VRARTYAVAIAVAIAVTIAIAVSRAECDKRLSGRVAHTDLKSIVQRADLHARW
jgi:hypothetical protein